jgi:hypothetical protein
MGGSTTGYGVAQKVMGGCATGYGGYSFASVRSTLFSGSNIAFVCVEGTLAVGVCGPSAIGTPTADGRLFLFLLDFGRQCRRRVFVDPFLAAQFPGYERVGQALRYCLSFLVKIKAVPARTCTANLLQFFQSCLLASIHRLVIRRSWHSHCGVRFELRALELLSRRLYGRKKFTQHRCRIAKHFRPK